jgi:hypothetical protein
VGDFVRPESIPLSISGGHTITIKKRLNHGEREDMYTRWAPFVEPGQPVHFDRREVRTSKVLTYLIGWTLKDDGGVPVPMSPQLDEQERLATIRSLDPDRFLEIHTAIEAHEDAYDEAKKNALAGAPASPTTSASPSAVPGDTSGSPSSTPTSTTS